MSKRERWALFLILLLVAACLLQPPVFSLLFQGDYLGQAASYGLAEDHWLVTALLWVHYNLPPFMWR